VGAVIGVLVSGRLRRGIPLPGSLGSLLVVALLLDLSMTLVIIPDATTATSPAGGIAKLPPVYVGGYMDAPAGHAGGVGVNVSFGGTDPSSVQEDNYLSGGIGVHGAGCCVDGIDYAYRFDVYLLHNGTEKLAATGWEACDDNAACGGHSWKVLLFSRTAALTGATPSSEVRLLLTWSPGIFGPLIGWYDSTDGAPPRTFAVFKAPSPENPNFNTGVLTGGIFGQSQAASYFFQFGVSSAYPIGHPGWSVTISCPAVLTSGWTCVDHANAVQGSQSYWKVIWRWGEDYPNVGFSAEGTAVVFGYSALSTNSGAKIW
ncbi:MAG TPA: hypothetical protein VFE91_05445, partial [Nitrososphaerales archaeon]|nr:hypothetical protein [Nitrososphaerales archaeon]